jgi:hypothetical protein
MTPQEKNVFGKLFTKTELGTHKLELALIDDIDKTKIEANNSEDVAISEISKALSSLDNANKLLDKAILNSKNVIDQIDKAKILAKDLGIPLPNNIDSANKYYQENIKSFNTIKSNISAFSSKIKSI